MTITTEPTPSPRQAALLRRPSYRDPRLVAGVLLVTASVVTGAKVVEGFQDTVPHYAAARPLVPGERLHSSDLTVVDVRLGQTSGNYLASDVPAEGLLVTQRVGQGGLVPREAVAKDGQVGLRPITLPVTAAAVAGLKQGDLVDVWVAVADDARNGAYLKPSLQVQGAQISRINDATSALSMSGADHSLTVVVPQARLADLLDAVANNARISLVKVGGQS